MTLVDLLVWYGLNGYIIYLIFKCFVYNSQCQKGKKATAGTSKSRCSVLTKSSGFISNSSSSPDIFLTTTRMIPLSMAQSGRATGEAAIFVVKWEGYGGNPTSAVRRCTAEPTLKSVGQCWSYFFYHLSLFSPLTLNSSCILVVSRDTAVVFGVASFAQCIYDPFGDLWLRWWAKFEPSIFTGVSSWDLLQVLFISLQIGSSWAKTLKVQESNILKPCK